MSGKVYIASMNMRGKWADRPDDVIIVNVTSAQSKTSPYRRDFSPMTPISGSYNGFLNFEAYWQSLKVYEGVPHEKSIKWWKEQTLPKRRYPGGKGRKVLYAIENDEKYDYITSRKKIYVPKYFKLMKDTESVIKLKNLVEQGKNIVIYDFDESLVEMRENHYV